MNISRNTQVTLEGRGVLTLRPADHVATGGEGSVYRASGTVVKLYTDPQKMGQHDMVGKVARLKTFQHPYIVAPRGLVFDQKSIPIGYWMDYAEGESLPPLFTNSYRAQIGFSEKETATLADRMREVMRTAHQGGAVMVDANELNWLAVLNGKNGVEPRALDVDSWAVGKWPAHAIMLSVKDWHTQGFNQQTDYFAWGIVTFQLYTGIHPYKGMLDGFKPSDMEGRMKANASVFHKEVRMPKVVRDFNKIPGPLLAWYMATFQNGERTIPPSPFDTGVTVQTIARTFHMTTTASGSLVFEKLFGETGNPAVRVFPCGVVLLQDGKLMDLSMRRAIGKMTDKRGELIQLAQGGWLKAERLNGVFTYTHIAANLQETPLSLDLNGRQFVRYENRLFLVTEQGLTELHVTMLGKPILSVGQTWGVMVNATRWFEGVGVQKGMEATFLMLPFGEKAVAQVRVKELDGLTPLAGLAGNRFTVLIVADKNGQYHKVEVTFSQDYTTYTYWQGAVDTPDLNATLIPKEGGCVCATIAKDGELDIFVPTTQALKRVQDKDISTDMQLARWGDKVLYLHQGNIWRVQTK